jgi:hypothetical protein
VVDFAHVSVLIFALVLAAIGWAPPALPPETTDAPPVDSTPPNDGAPQEPPREAAPPGELAPPGRTTLPPGLEPVPFPLDDQRTEPTPLDGGANGGGQDPLLPPEPTSKRRSIVDLRDPFDRPPPRPRPTGQPDGVRLLMPDLKDPFAPGLRRVRSQRLDQYVPNDIRDPFRDRPRTGLPPCARTTDDGTVVQRPGGPPQGACQSSPIDLRDPFTRDQ